MTTIFDIEESLRRRGFLEDSGNPAWLCQVQLNAVIEELGEVARKLRRHEQGVLELCWPDLMRETADVVISAVCLHAYAAGNLSSQVISEKLAADERRGWRHNGVKPE